MQNRRIKISLEDINDIMEEKLSKGGEIIYSPKGRSMLPCIREGRDSVTLKKYIKVPEAGDIVFYRRADGAFVLHRIIKCQKDGRYTICGDNQCVLEKDVDKSTFIAVVSGIKRGNKEINLNSAVYKAYYHLLFLRRFYIKNLNILKAVIRKTGRFLNFGKDGK